MTATTHGRTTLALGLCLSALVWAAPAWAGQPVGLGLKRLGQAGQSVAGQLKATGARLAALGKKLLPVKFGDEEQGQPAVSPEPESAGETAEAVAVEACPHCQAGWLGGWSTHACPACSAGRARARYHRQSRLLQRALARKFAYFIPSGCGGAGCPPFGCYHFVYAVQPDYFDPRDGQIFAAQGVGVPVAVPLAPVVHYQFNYSHGIPASRITPLGDRIELKRVDY